MKHSYLFHVLPQSIKIPFYSVLPTFDPEFITKAGNKSKTKQCSPLPPSSKQVRCVCAYVLLYSFEVKQANNFLRQGTGKSSHLKQNTVYHSTAHSHHNIYSERKLKIYNTDPPLLVTFSKYKDVATNQTQ